MYFSFSAKKTKLCIKKACENSLNVYNSQAFPVWQCQFGISFLMVASTQVFCSDWFSWSKSNVHAFIGSTGKCKALTLSEKLLKLLVSRRFLLSWQDPCCEKLPRFCSSVGWVLPLNSVFLPPCINLALHFSLTCFAAFLRIPELSSA